MDEMFAETDLLLAEQAGCMDLSTKYRNGANGITEGRTSTASTDDELLEIGDGRMEALENWADSDDLEPKYCSKPFYLLHNFVCSYSTPLL